MAILMAELLVSHVIKTIRAAVQLLFVPLDRSREAKTTEEMIVTEEFQ